MTTQQIIRLLFCLTLVACNNSTNNSVSIKKDTTVQAMTDESFLGYKISWLDSSKVVYAVDTLLMHKGKAFICDSVIAIDYTGFLGEHTFLPLNDKGQWINTIKKREKLSAGQIQILHSVFGDKKSFNNPNKYLFFLEQCVHCRISH